MYPWPIGDFDNAMDVALDAAMNYLQRTGQAQKFVEVQRIAAVAIVAAWKQGVRHRVKLTNIAIAAVERKMNRRRTQNAHNEISRYRIYRGPSAKHCLRPLRPRLDFEIATRQALCSQSIHVRAFGSFVTRPTASRGGA